METDRQRFTRVFETYFEEVCHFLEGMLSDWSSAQDVGQEVFVRLLRTGLDTVAPGQERFWVFRVGRNLALNELERNRRRWQLLSRWAERRPDRPSAGEEEIAMGSPRSLLNFRWLWWVGQ